MEETSHSQSPNSNRLSPAARLGLAAALAISVAAGALHYTADIGESHFPDKVPTAPVEGGPNTTVGAPQPGPATPTTRHS